MISIILPCYNEELTIKQLINGIRNQIAKINDSDFEVIVVNDGSRDNSAEILKQIQGINVIHHPYNLGNGAAVKRGIKEAQGEYVLLMDADGQHPSEEIPNLIANMDGYDMVVVARTSSCNTLKIRNFGNWFLSHIATLLTGREISDLTSGFRIIRRSILLNYLHLLPDRYSYPTTITMLMITEGYFVKFIPVDSVIKRQFGKSGIVYIRDGIRFMNILFRIIMMFSPQKVFLPISLVLFLSGLLVGGFQLIHTQGLRGTSILLLMVSSYLFLFGLLAEQIARLRRQKGHP